MGLRGTPLEEIRRRYWVEGRRAGPAVVRELAADPRSGARELAELLEARRRRAAAEARRLRKLFATERALARDGVASVAGVDEVGMGPLAGPVVAAAVVLAPGARVPGLDDSKRLPPPERARVEREVRSVARAVGIGMASRAEIDRVNIYHAGLLAMRRAVRALGLDPELVLVDGRTIPRLELSQRAVPGGDARVASIAAASVVAKVRRDAWMAALDRRYPGYGFAHNAGYATAEHLRALARRGPTPEHRRSFAPVRAALLTAREGGRACRTS